MNTIFVMGNKPYDTRSGSTISQNRVKTTKYGVESFAYQGAKCWNLSPANIKEIEDLIYLDGVFHNRMDPYATVGAMLYVP